MLTKEENERLIRTGAGTPTGETFRRYWLPALLSEELPEPDCPPVRVRLLGEDLIAFRDTNGKVGLVDAYCPHRRAPMFFGRNEECGLRCVYHGWKFDVNGKCVDMPSEPPDSLFKTKVAITSYPTFEGGDCVWAYLGPAETMPGPPDYEWLRVPKTHRFVSKTFEHANYLQALEGGLDTAHSSFLHNDDMADRKRPRTVDGHPSLEVEAMPYGFRYVGKRDIGPNGFYVRIYHFIMPAQQVRGLVTKWTSAQRSEHPTIHGHVWVPIDDEHTWVYNFMYGYDEDVPITEDEAWAFESWTGRGKEHVFDRYYLKATLDNDYFIDRSLQKQRSFTGIDGINTQDIAVQEGMGPICDRTQEHLGTTDRAIIVTRQMLLEASREVAAGRAPRGTDPASYRGVRAYDDVIPRDQDWHALEPELVAKW